MFVAYLLLEYMDDDIRTALFEDGDENGLFEELDDDFVAQVLFSTIMKFSLTNHWQALAQPAEPDFDFEAHIAKLIANRFVSALLFTKLPLIAYASLVKEIAISFQQGRGKRTPRKTRNTVMTKWKKTAMKFLF